MRCGAAVRACAHVQAFLHVKVCVFAWPEQNQWLNISIHSTRSDAPMKLSSLVYILALAL